MLFERQIFLQFLAIGCSGLGFLSAFAGLIIMVSTSFSQPARQLAAHSAKLGQKSLTSDITSVVQSTVQLTEAVNKLTQSNTGRGFILIVLGGLFILGAYSLVSV